MRRTGWQNDEIPGLKMPRHTAGDARGPVFGICKRPAGHERAGNAKTIFRIAIPFGVVVVDYGVGLTN
jgi:hypothetical protein